MRTKEFWIVVGLVVFVALVAIVCRDAEPITIK